jgi:hypothetical protein
VANIADVVSSARIVVTVSGITLRDPDGKGLQSNSVPQA